jgi:hypothetical protein
MSERIGFMVARCTAKSVALKRPGHKFDLLLQFV